MTVLVDHEIRRQIERGHIGVYPFDPSLIQPNSLDIRLGNHFVFYKPGVDIIDTRVPETIAEYTKELRADAFVVYPFEFVLARSLEVITMPEDMMGILEGKSSLARLGVTIHQTGGVIDSGFAGSITFEISNVNSHPVTIYEGMPVAQIVFHDLGGAVVEKPYSGKYQHQIETTIARY